MARARNIKPGFFINDDLAEIEPLGRLLFAGLWTVADREGRLEDKPKKIKASILPYDDCDIDKLLQDLHDSGFICRYTVDGQNYIQIINFLKHQNPHHKEIASIIPPPNGVDQCSRNSSNISQELRQEIFKRDGYKCLKCGSTEHLSIDHIVALSNGGTDDTDNLQTLCLSCNASKGNRYSIKYESSINHACINHEPSMTTQASINPADSLNLIPDSPIPLPPTPEEEIFEYWQEQNIIVHQKASDSIKSAIKKALKENTIDEIKECISHYSEMLKDEKYNLCNYTWGLDTFLTRKNGYRLFLSTGEKWINYLRDKDKRGSPVSITDYKKTALEKMM